MWAGSPDDTVIPREGGESSTPQLLGSITAVSEYWIARSSRAMTPSVGRTVSTPSFRAQRLVRRSFSEGGSNPESFRGGSLDCFAALAMTEQGASASFSNTHLNVADTPSRPRGAIRPSFASSLCPLEPRGRREGRVLTSHPRSAARKAHAGRTAQQHTGGANHSAFPAQWLDGLCRALPGAEFVLASLAFAEFTGTAPVDATAASARA